jgi:aspartokinase
MCSFELITQEIAQNSQHITYTHSEVIALTACLEETIPNDLSFDNHWKIEGMLKGLRKHGITHNTRSNIAKIILKTLEKDRQNKEEMAMLTIPDDF